MSKEARASYPIRGLLPPEIEGFDSLAARGLDLRWSWSQDPDDTSEPFNMGYLAMQGAGAVNCVSRLHGNHRDAISRRRSDG